MQYKAATVKEYIDQLPDDRQPIIKKLRAVIKKNIPEGYNEVIGYGMPSYSVPHTIYPAGYHCPPKLPLLFPTIASQKNYVALYHMGIYANPKLMNWFVKEFPKHSKLKLDMGKSCIRFKKPDQIPFKLMGELAGKMTVADWIKIYEKNVKR